MKRFASYQSHQFEAKTNQYFIYANWLVTERNSSRFKCCVFLLEQLTQQAVRCCLKHKVKIQYKFYAIITLISRFHAYTWFQEERNTPEIQLVCQKSNEVSIQYLVMLFSGNAMNVKTCSLFFYLVKCGFMFHCVMLLKIANKTKSIKIKELKVVYLYQKVTDKFKWNTRQTPHTYTLGCTV